MLHGIGKERNGHPGTITMKILSSSRHTSPKPRGPDKGNLGCIFPEKMCLIYFHHFSRTTNQNVIELVDKVVGTNLPHALGPIDESFFAHSKFTRA